MHKLTFTLKQHTPIIHFQHDQDGATLRATEVKPKLDKFLWNIWCNEFKTSNYKWEEAYSKYKHFLIGDTSEGSNIENKFFDEGYNSINYKIKFKDVNSLSDKIPSRFPCYFGNLKEDKFFNWTVELINVEIRTPVKGLIGELEKNIFDFFLQTNFGTRQSKGFGSFLIDQGDKLYNQNFKLFSFFIVKASENNYLVNQKKLFWNINLLYSALRGGINGFQDEHGKYIKEIYIKSLLWLYCKRIKEVNWEKRKIKKEFFDDKLIQQINGYANEPDFVESPIGFESESYRVIKEVLGFATIEEWKMPYTPTMNESKLIIKTIIEVDRFKSPLYFKPIKDNNQFKVLIGFDSNFNEVNLLDRDVSFACEDKTPFTLKTLKSFSHKKLFDFLFDDEFSFKEHVNKGNNTSIFFRLNIILNELKNNV